MADVTKDGVGIRCTEAEFRDLAPAEERLAEFVPGYETPVQLLTAGWQDAGGLVAEGGAIPRIPEQETIAIVPPGEVAERRGDHVRATDGEAGQLRALRIDPGNGQVTTVLVRQGHRRVRRASYSVSSFVTPRLPRSIRSVRSSSARISELHKGR
jgi:hypothetical protein